MYRRLGPPATWQPIPHATTSCFALGIGTAIALNASDDVAVLRRRLAHFRGRHVTDGAGAVAYDGPVELYLGVAAAHLERFDDAVADLEAASRSCVASGAVGFDVHARYELAAVLTRRARPGDLASARTLGMRVIEQASAIGMAPWAERGRLLVERLDDERGNPLTPREQEVAALVAQWTDQPADRRAAVPVRAHRAEPCPAHPHQARPAQPEPDRRLGGNANLSRQAE